MNYSCALASQILLSLPYFFYMSWSKVAQPLLKKKKLLAIRQSSLFSYLQDFTGPLVYALDLCYSSHDLLLPSKSKSIHELLYYQISLSCQPYLFEYLFPTSIVGVNHSVDVRFPFSVPLGSHDVLAYSYCKDLDYREDNASVQELKDPKFSILKTLLGNLIGFLIDKHGLQTEEAVVFWMVQIASRLSHDRQKAETNMDES